MIAGGCERSNAPKQGPWALGQLELLVVPSPLESWGGYEAKPEERVSRGGNQKPFSNGQRRLGQEVAAAPRA